jgi:hypothetical protein
MIHLYDNDISYQVPLIYVEMVHEIIQFCTILNKCKRDLYEILKLQVM